MWICSQLSMGSGWKFDLQSMARQHASWQPAHSKKMARHQAGSQLCLYKHRHASQLLKIWHTSK
jgi:hypothetical protein